MATSRSQSILGRPDDFLKRDIAHVPAPAPCKVCGETFQPTGNSSAFIQDRDVNSQLCMVLCNGCRKQAMAMLYVPDVPDAPKFRTLEALIETLRTRVLREQERRRELADPNSFYNTSVWRIENYANSDPFWKPYTAKVIPDDQGDIGSRGSAVFELLQDMPPHVKGDRVQCERGNINGSHSWMPANLKK